jgi:hypothetical protein
MIRKFFGVLLFWPVLNWPVFFGIFAEATLAQGQASAPVQCVRSIPQPIVKKSVFPNANFALKDIDYVGVVVPLGLETVELSNGDKVIITNSGCENFTLSFQFETSRFKGQLQDTKYWLARSVELMQLIEPGLEPALNLKQGINMLEKYTQTAANPSIGHEIDYGGQEIRSIVQLADVKQHGNQNFTVKVVFSTGPL